jgi:hypothetical protein
MTSKMWEGERQEGYDTHIDEGSCALRNSLRSMTNCAHLGSLPSYLISGLCLRATDRSLPTHPLEMYALDEWSRLSAARR